MTAAMNAANERANELFRNGVITVMSLTSFCIVCRVIYFVAAMAVFSFPNGELIRGSLLFLPLRTGPRHGLDR